MLFQNPVYNEILYAAAIFIASIVLAKLLFFLARKATEKTRTGMDDKLLKSAKTPFFLLVISISAYYGLGIISLFDSYSAAIKNVFSVWFVLISAVLAARILNSITGGLLMGTEAKGKKSVLDMTVGPLIEKLISLVVYIIGGLMLLRIFHIEITPLLASLGIASLAVALALQDTLANFFASIYMVTERPINVGDYIKLETGQEGYVESISWRNSTIRTLPGNRVVIPNSNMSKMIITNYYYPSRDMAVVLQCGVAYDSDLGKVERVTIETARKTLKTVKGGAKDFEPFIRYHTFGDSNIQFSIILRVNEYVDQYLVTHEFIKNLMEAYRKNRIEVSFPARNIYMRK